VQAPAKSLSYTVFMTDGTGEIRVNGAESNAEVACRFLEKGGVIYFEETPFFISKADREFLLSIKQNSADYTKNIAYRPAQDRVTGLSKSKPEDTARLHQIMSDFHKQAYRFLENFLRPYAEGWKADFATFRPIEEKGRKMRVRARNDLLHVDSFATRPIYGNRILRTFLNVNPTEKRIWHTADTFEQLLKTFSNQVAAPAPFKPSTGKNSVVKAMAQKLGFKLSGDSGYDEWMLNFHNFLKENAEFQANCRKDRWEFPANSSWIVFTDMVSHAVLSGQYALEQTFIVSQDNLVLPQKAPINLLRKTYSITG
jgi:hypothetical protein